MNNSMWCIPEADYTIELRHIKPLFDFNYDFYDDQFKCEFEKKFRDYYYYNEIGFETVERFKQNLKALLNLNAPYYTQLYHTELEAEGINFLLNKDLRETFLRTVDRTDNIKGTNVSNRTDKSVAAATDKTDINKTTEIGTTEKGSNTVTGKKTENEKNSNVGDGVASAALTDNLLTNVTGRTGTSEDKTTGTNESTSNGKDLTKQSTDQQSTREDTGKTNGENTEDRTGKETEKTEFISQGNIGITSSAELLEKWRSVLINIDKMIIMDCQNLFMGIF